jgi:hypothetical protein
MGAGDGTGTTTGSGTAAEGISSSWDAPQFLQNFAFGATGFPHSGQNVMLITTVWLNVVHKEHSISIQQKIRYGKIKKIRGGPLLWQVHIF